MASMVSRSIRMISLSVGLPRNIRLVLMVSSSMLSFVRVLMNRILKVSTVVSAQLPPVALVRLLALDGDTLPDDFNTSLVHGFHDDPFVGCLTPD